MPLATFADVLRDADTNNYAVGSFNAWDLYSATNIVATAERLKSPVIIALWKEELDLAGEKELFDICLGLGRRAAVPVVIFLDHAKDLVDLERALELGATSVMVDGSHLPLDENIALTNQAAEIAHKNGASIEGEIGILGEEDGADANEKIFTDIDEAKRFAAETNVEALAVTIGNAHGFYKKDPKLDFDRLSAIDSVVEIPLVLHGGTGIPHEDIQRAIGMGIAKVNIGSECRKAFMDGLRSSLAENGPDEHFPHNIFPAAMKSHREMVEEKIRVLRSDGKA